MEIHRCHRLTELKERLGLTDEEIYTHGLEVLIKSVLPDGTYRRMMQSEAGRLFRTQVNRWRVSWRYDGRDWNLQQAR